MGIVEYLVQGRVAREIIRRHEDESLLRGRLLYYHVLNADGTELFGLCWLDYCRCFYRFAGPLELDLWFPGDWVGTLVRLNQILYDLSNLVLEM